MADIIARGIAVQAQETADYVDYKVEALSVGILYKGAVDYYSSLPTSGVAEGDAYTVKYTGSSGTTEDGTLYAWGEYQGTLQWIKLGKDYDTQISALNLSISNEVSRAQAAEDALEDDIDDLETAVAGKQAQLTAGANITIENNVISATGGGGGEPDAYIKNAAVSGNKLTLTKKDNTTVEYQPTTSSVEGNDVKSTGQAEGLVLKTNGEGGAIWQAATAAGVNSIQGKTGDFALSGAITVDDNNIINVSNTLYNEGPGIQIDSLTNSIMVKPGNGIVMDEEQGTVGVQSFVGATATTPGVSGIIPAPGVGMNNQYLRSDGTWVDGTSSINSYVQSIAVTEGSQGSSSSLNINYFNAGVAGSDTFYATRVLPSETELENPLQLQYVKIDNVNYKVKDTTYNDATTSVHGLMSTDDKTKLNGLVNVSGTNDGTEWTDLTINGVTKEIPQDRLSYGEEQELTDAQFNQVMLNLELQATKTTVIDTDLLNRTGMTVPCLANQYEAINCDVQVESLVVGSQLEFLAKYSDNTTSRVSCTLTSIEDGVYKAELEEVVDSIKEFSFMPSDVDKWFRIKIEDEAWTNPTLAEIQLGTHLQVTYTPINQELIPSKVSGIDDGTNWTSLTINGVNRAIPAGGTAGVTSLNGKTGAILIHGGSDVEMSEDEYGLYPQTIYGGAKSYGEQITVDNYTGTASYDSENDMFSYTKEYSGTEFAQGDLYEITCTLSNGTEEKVISGESECFIENDKYNIVWLNSEGFGISYWPAQTMVEMWMENGTFGDYTTFVSLLIKKKPAVYTTIRARYMPIDNSSIVISNGNMAVARPIPAAPATDGNYVLKCAVSGGAVTYTWEVDE